MKVMLWYLYLMQVLLKVKDRIIGFQSMVPKYGFRQQIIKALGLVSIHLIIRHLLPNLSFLPHHFLHQLTFSRHFYKQNFTPHHSPSQ